MPFFGFHENIIHQWIHLSLLPLFTLTCGAEIGVNNYFITAVGFCGEYYRGVCYRRKKNNITCLDLEKKCEICTLWNYFVILVCLLIMLLSSGYVYMILICSNSNYHPHMDFARDIWTQKQCSHVQWVSYSSNNIVFSIIHFYEHGKRIYTISPM